MARYLSIVVVAALASLALSCSSTDETQIAAELGPCCEDALALQTEMPGCCASSLALPEEERGGCCTEGMAAATPDADRPGCCAKTLALADQMKPCCLEALTGGEVAECCAGLRDAWQK